MLVMGDATVDGAVPREVADVDPLDLSVPVKNNGRSNVKAVVNDRQPVDESSDSDRIVDDSRAPPRYCPTSSPLNTEKTFHSAPAVLQSALPEDNFYENTHSPDTSEPSTRPLKAYPHVDLTYGLKKGSSSTITSLLPSSYDDGPSALALPSSYDAPSPGSSSSTGTFGMVSYIMQRRRRHEASDNKEGEQSASKIVSASSTATIAMEEDTNSDPDSKKHKSETGERKDDAYWERRRKNNEAAKRSRDARRQKEEDIAMRAAFLEQENLKLRAQVAILKNETAKLHYLLYNRV